MSITIAENTQLLYNYVRIQISQKKRRLKKYNSGAPDRINAAEFRQKYFCYYTMLHHILRTRFNNGLPTIVTTNLPVKSWEAAYGGATESFINEAFATIELESIRGDLRK